MGEGDDAVIHMGRRRAPGRSIAAAMALASVVALPAVPVAAAGTRVPRTGAATTPAATLTPSIDMNGGLDPTFDGDGRVTTSFGDTPIPDVVAIQADGKIVAAGAASGHFAVARYTSAGALDPTFGGTGTIIAPGDGLFENATGLAIQADGKIVIAGPTAPGGFCCQTNVLRFETDGDPDLALGGTGRVIIPGIIADGVAVQADGKIVVGGSGPGAITPGMKVYRMSSTGAVDSGFGVDGFASGSLFGAANGGRIVIQPDGKVVGVGRSNNDEILVARFTTDGQPDATFSTDGYTTMDIDFTDIPTSVALQADGRIVVAGYASNRSFVARFESDGDPDPTFSGDGRISTTFISSNEQTTGVAVAPDGSIVTVGWSFHDSDLSWIVARYGADGTIIGRTATDFGTPSPDQAYGVAIQPDGKIVATGGTGSGSNCGNPCQWSLARYTDIPPVRTAATDPGLLDFGAKVVGTAPATLSSTVINTSNATVTLGSMGISGAAASDFSITSTDCPHGALAAHATCDVDVTYDPHIAGAKSATVEIASDSEIPVTIQLVASATAPSSGLSWGTTRLAGPNYTWNAGNALARTVVSGSQRLHVTYATDRIGSKWAANSGPYMGIYYTKSTTGSTWTTPLRLNPSNQHAGRLGMAAAGSRLYVTWVSQTRITSFLPTAPRILYVRVNTNHGATTSWRTTIRLTSTTGRVDYPTVAASGNDAYIAYTDSVTGAVRVISSHDGGLHWSNKQVGTSTASDSQGKYGEPSIAASGTTVVVGFRANGAGAMQVRRSDDRGTTWSAPVTMTTHGFGTLSVAARGTRVAAAWSTGDQVHSRVNDAGTWKPERLVSISQGDSLQAYSPTVVLQGTSRIAVSWAENLASHTDWSQLRWAESKDDGAHWYAIQTIATTSSYTHRDNDWPSVVWPTESTRQVLWNAWSPASNYYRLDFRIGTGLPVGPAMAAASRSTDGATAASDGASKGRLHRHGS